MCIRDRIKAAVELSPEPGAVTFLAGEGVGTVTLPGLKIAVGEPAINPVPRAMIERAVREVIGARGAKVTISAPLGREVAKRTFNPRLGIVGGISILGTSGRVKPMNEAALLESLTLELLSLIHIYRRRRRRGGNDRHGADRQMGADSFPHISVIRGDRLQVAQGRVAAGGARARGGRSRTRAQAGRTHRRARHGTA